jgi:hypothetical protein
MYELIQANMLSLGVFPRRRKAYCMHGYPVPDLAASFVYVILRTVGHIGKLSLLAYQHSSTSFDVFLDPSLHSTQSECKCQS